MHVLTDAREDVRYYSSLLSLKRLLLNLELPVVDEADRPVGLTVAG